MKALQSGESGSWKPMWMLGNITMGKVLGIFGFGRVGFGVARRMKPFAVSKILYTDVKNASFADGLASLVSFDELVSQSDILCICCAVNPQTIGKFNIDVFKKMKKTAILINTSRGIIINQDDLCEALKKEYIAAAALDVTNPEPLPGDHLLMNMKNCIILPHMGTNTWEARISMSENTAKNIIGILK